METEKKLDDRLMKIASCFRKCQKAADIGADHGQLSLFLLSSNIVSHMTVTDISAPSLKKAMQLIEEKGYKDRAHFVVTDGLKDVQDQMDFIAIAGMGGHTICQILMQGKDKLQGAELVLSAHTDVPLVRKMLENLGYMLVEEKIAFVKNKYYVVLHAVIGRKKLSEKEAFLGPCLTQKSDALYIAYLENRIQRYKLSVAEQKKQECALLKEELDRAKATCAGCVSSDR